jgi:hypothetical protein
MRSISRFCHFIIVITNGLGISVKVVIRAAKFALNLTCILKIGCCAFFKVMSRCNVTGGMSLIALAWFRTLS